MARRLPPANRPPRPRSKSRGSGSRRHSERSEESRRGSHRRNRPNVSDTASARPGINPSPKPLGERTPAPTQRSIQTQLPAPATTYRSTVPAHANCSSQILLTSSRLQSLVENPSSRPIPLRKSRVRPCAGCPTSGDVVFFPSFVLAVIPSNSTSPSRSNLSTPTRMEPILSQAKRPEDIPSGRCLPRST